MKRILKSKITWTILILLAVGTALFTSWSTWKKEQRNDSKELAQGQAVYERNCQSCHGVMGVGQEPASPMGGLDEQGNYLAPALDDRGHAWHHSDQVLFEVVRHGSPEGTSRMKGFAGRLTKQETWAVIHWFQSLWTKEHFRMQQGMQQGMK